MAKSINEVMGGIFCCMESYHQDDPWCDDCPYEQTFDCKNTLRNDITYWAKLGKLELGKDGIWQPAGCLNNISKPKTKRKNGRRYSDERRNNRQYETDDF